MLCAMLIGNRLLPILGYPQCKYGNMNKLSTRHDRIGDSRSTPKLLRSLWRFFAWVLSLFLLVVRLLVSLSGLWFYWQFCFLWFFINEHVLFVFCFCFSPSVISRFSGCRSPDWSGGQGSRVWAVLRVLPFV